MARERAPGHIGAVAVLPLDPRWLIAIDAVAREVLGRRDRAGDALIAEVAALSQLYTRERDALAAQGDPIAARLRFFLPRDLPKITGPLLELAARRALPPGPRWRVLDLGAGLGTTTLGAATVARSVGVEGLDVVAVERDGQALAIAAALAARCGKGELADVCAAVALRPMQGDIARPPSGPWDLVLVGLALNELWREAPESVARRVEWLRALRDELAPGGAVVVVEPALRETSRELMAARDALVAAGVPVFSPCTHAGACPLLARERDWCHEEAPDALPEPLVAVARGAGLRFERLTWSHLVRRAAADRPAGAWRVVGGPIATKGRVEWHLCGPGGASRLARLDRHRGAGDPLDGLARGDTVHVDPPPAAGATVRADRAAISRGPSPGDAGRAPS